MNDHLADKNFDSIKLKLLDEVFLLVDESEIDGKNFINILAGSLNCLSETFLIVCKEIQTAPNASLMVRAIDDAVQKIGIKRENFSLLITDTAPYMTVLVEFFYLFTQIYFIPIAWLICYIIVLLVSKTIFLLLTDLSVQL